jgi:predicted  nucleic acid-binding Zn-ribbon protein
MHTTEFPAAVQTLAAAQLAAAGIPLTEEIGAVRRLGEAPAEDLWNRGLLIGLHSRRPEVVEATVRAAVDRLARMTDPEAQDGLLTAILDACFLHLPGGRSRSERGDGEARHAIAIEQAAGRLITAVGRLLRNGSPELEHHRARLLARARQIKHRAGWGFLASAVVALQKDLAAGEGSDALVAEELGRLRKVDLYISPHSSETALLAYLERDRELTLEQVSQELWQAYRILLAVQTKERAGRAILRAMDNLIHWLDATPQSPRSREDVLGEVVQMARLGVPREQLQPRIGRHLEAHLEILTGPEHPEDLLVQLRTRYDAAEGEEILVKGLELLRRLPLVRLRSGELCEFILAPARRQRSGTVWQALLALVESLVTGIADLVPSREALDAREQRRLRLLRELLAQDRRLRELLYRLATDRSLDLSHDPQVDAHARETAWRILLRCLPPDRIERQREGLLGHEGRFFFATLEEAGRGHRRELWEALLEHWDGLLGTDRPTDERRQRLRAVSDFFRQTRDYAALREEAGGLGPLLKLAFDDPDGEVSEMAEAALVETGYGLEVERERERRRLLALRDHLSASNQQVIAYETDIARLGQEAVTTQVGRAEQALAVQDLLQKREGELTDGWIFTSALQVDLEEVRVELMEAMERAEEEMVLLRQLQRRMQQEHVAAQQVHGAIQSLVRQQEQREGELQSLRAQLDRAQSALARARNEVESLSSQYSYQQRNTPSPPRRTGDNERDQARLDEYRRDCDRHASELRHLSSRIAEAKGDIQSASSEIASCERRIAAVQDELRRLQARIDQMKGTLRELRSRIEGLGRELEHREATLAALRREIERLAARSRDLQSRQEAHARQVGSSLAANTRQIQETQTKLRDIQDRLQALSVRLNQTGHLRDQQKTESQRLVQAIDSGREQYDRVAERAIPESRQADVTGHSQREAHEREVTDAQEGFVQYAEGVHHAVGRDEPLAVRTRRRRQKPEATQKTGGGNR